MNRRRLVLLFICVGVGTVFMLRPWREPEPEYNGRLLSQWLLFYSRATSVSSGAPSRQESVVALQHIGTNALPYMVKWMRYEISPQRRCLNFAVAELHLTSVRIFWDNAMLRAEAARQGFKVFGPSANPVIPELIRLATEPGVESSAQRAIGALVDIGAESLPNIIAAFPAQQGPQRCRLLDCIRMLRDSGIDTTPALPTLTGALDDPDSQVREVATNALRRLYLNR